MPRPAIRKAPRAANSREVREHVGERVSTEDESLQRSQSGTYHTQQARHFSASV